MKTVKGIVVAAAAVAAAVCASSCSTSRILVGDGKPKEPMIEVSKEHNAHFLGGLVKTGKTIAQSMSAMRRITPYLPVTGSETSCCRS